MNTFKIELKKMSVNACEYDFKLDDKFFADLDVADIQKGELNVHLKVTKMSSAFILNFHTEGSVVITCDRCLDEMDQLILTDNQLRVKLGSVYAEDDDMITVPEDDGFIDVSWLIYEFIALNIPMKHIHAPGKCNQEMLDKLGKHWCVSTTDDEEDEETEDWMQQDSTDEIAVDIDQPNQRWKNELKKILDNN